MCGTRNRGSSTGKSSSLVATNLSFLCRATTAAVEQQQPYCALMPGPFSRTQDSVHRVSQPSNTSVHAQRRQDTTPQSNPRESMYKAWTRLQSAHSRILRSIPDPFSVLRSPFSRDICIDLTSVRCMMHARLIQPSVDPRLPAYPSFKVQRESSMEVRGVSSTPPSRPLTRLSFPAKSAPSLLTRPS